MTSDEQTASGKSPHKIKCAQRLTTSKPKILEHSFLFIAMENETNLIGQKRELDLRKI